MPASPASAPGAVFITGAAAGIGAATTRLLSARGYTVYAGVHKDTGSLDELPGVRQVPVDVTYPDSVAAAAAQVAEATGPGGLRALINNAGIIVQGPLELIPPSELRRQFDVNTLGAAYAVQAFLPLLRAAGSAGRVVNVSAPTASVPVPFLSALSGSKAALSALSAALRLELAPWGIAVIEVVPGATDTRIFAKADAAARESVAAADPALARLYSARIAAVAKASARQRMRPADAVAKTIAAAVEARTPKRRYVSGADARMAGVVSRMPAATRDRLITGMLGLRSRGE